MSDDTSTLSSPFCCLGSSTVAFVLLICSTACANCLTLIRHSSIVSSVTSLLRINFSKLRICSLISSIFFIDLIPNIGVCSLAPQAVKDEPCPHRSVGLPLGEGEHLHWRLARCLARRPAVKGASAVCRWNCWLGHNC